MLNHQSLKDLELLNLQKIDIFVKILSILRGFSILVLSKLDGRAPNPYIWVLGGVVFYKDPGTGLEFKSVSVFYQTFVPQNSS